MNKKRDSLHLMTLGEDVSCGWIGLKGVSISDGKEWVHRLRSVNPKILTQACDARLIAGHRHFELLARQSWEAKRRSQLYAEKFEVDLLMRIACERQIKEALSKAGVNGAVKDVAVIGFGSRSELRSFLDKVSSMWKQDDAVLELTSSKKRFLVQHHEIGNDVLSLSNASDLFPRLLSERAALLQVRD